MTSMYGIPNCDTIKKARRWLTDNNVEFDFYDYKKQTPDQAVLAQAIAEHGKELVVNKRGTTYRKLEQSDKEKLDSAAVIEVLVAHPSVIKRPILVHNEQTLVGFSDASYRELFGLA